MDPLKMYFLLKMGIFHCCKFQHRHGSNLLKFSRKKTKPMHHQRFLLFVFFSHHFSGSNPVVFWDWHLFRPKTILSLSVCHLDENVLAYRTHRSVVHTKWSLIPLSTRFFLIKPYTNLPLMAEILHRFIGSLSHYL